MHQVRIFTGLENDTQKLTNDVNAWLKSSNAKVINVFGNIAPQTPGDRTDNSRLLGTENVTRRHAPSDIMLVVLYEQ